MADHHVDRPEVEAGQPAQLTGTNRSIDLLPGAPKAPHHRPRAAPIPAPAAHKTLPLTSPHITPQHRVPLGAFASTGLARAGLVAMARGQAPDPIPNSAVKTLSAHGTAAPAAEESVAARPTPAKPIPRKPVLAKAPARARIHPSPNALLIRGCRTVNLLSQLPDAHLAERVDVLLTRPGLRIERIVSLGQASPPEFWYDQEEGEWVLLLAGAARLRFADEADARLLGPGDCLEIAPHRRHRVDWTEPTVPTIWLAVFYR